MAGVLTVSPPDGGGDPVSADHSLDPPSPRAQFSRVVGYITHRVSRVTDKPVGGLRQAKEMQGKRGLNGDDK